MAQEYLLFLDEFHSIVQYLYSSDTLNQKRREVFKDIQWLIRSAKKVIVSDNTVSNHDFHFLESAMNETGKHTELNFHVNTYNTFQGTPVVRVSDREKMFQMIKKRFHNGKAVTVACNTKADAVYIRQRLWDETPDETMRNNILLYTSDTSNSVNIAQEVERWHLCCVIHSPKISTGIDYHPTEPIDTFYFGRGEATVCPATAIQMVTRTRKIKTLYICTDRMRTKPRFESEAAMNAELDMMQKNAHAMAWNQQTMHDFLVLKELVDKTWSPAQLEDVYSDNKFSIGYRRFLWYDTIMRDSWDANFIQGLQKRGFIIVNEEMVGDEILLQDPAERTAVMVKCQEEMIKEFGLWTANKDTKFASTFDTKLANIRDIPYAPLNQGLAETLLSAKSALNVVIQTFTETEDKWAGRRVQNIFLRKCAEDSNKNVLLGMYTAVKLQKMILHSQTVEFDERKYLPVCNMVLLLHELMVAFNTGLPEAVHLKVLNITLSQCDYDEDEEIAIDNNAWTLYQRYSKMVRTRPTTRRALMGVIFSLSQKIFGKYFTYKNETCRRSMDKTKIKCYNYKSNDTIVRVHVKLADWSKRNLDDFDRDIVAKYKLAECQKRDREGPTLNDFFAISNDERFIPDPPLAPVILKPMVLSYVAPQNPKKRTKRLHLVDTVPSKHQVHVPLSCDAQNTTSQQELRRVQLKRQKEWHSDLNSEKHDDKQEQKRQRRDGGS